MGYEYYRSKELAHSAKGSGWKNHKYLSKYMKNGKWYYVYKGGVGKSTDDDNTHTIKDTEKEYKQTDEYYKIHKDKQSGQYKKLHYTEYTRNGNSWLNKRFEIKNGNDVKVYKEKGKISQGIEKTASKGKSYIEKLSKKKKKK